MDKKIVMGVDLNLKSLIATSTCFSFADTGFFSAIQSKEDANSISEWIPIAARWLIDRALERKVNVIALEALNTHSISCSAKQKRVLDTLLVSIPNYAKEANLGILWVDPRYTSQTCFHCGGTNTVRNDRGIQCLDGCFIGEEKADYNAACVVGAFGIIAMVLRDKRKGIDSTGDYLLAMHNMFTPIGQIAWAKQSIDGSR